MKNESLKMRTITITGPFGVDSDGDDCGYPGNRRYIYSLHELKCHPAFDYEVEDVPRGLPTEKGALIRATVHEDGVSHAGQLLECVDPPLWRGLGGALDGGWYRSAHIGDDWVELVPRSE